MKKLIAKYPELWKLFKFGVVGVINTAVDFIVYTLLIYLIPFFEGAPEYAKVISYSCGLLNSFFMNRVFTFNSKIKLLSVRGLKFIIANLITLSISLFIIHVCTKNFELSNLVANIIATPVTLVINFVLNRLFVFNQKQAADHNQN